MEKLAKLIFIVLLVFFVTGKNANATVINQQTDSSNEVTTNTNSPVLVIGSFVAEGSGYNADLQLYTWGPSTSGVAVILSTNNTTNGSGAICRWDLNSVYSGSGYPTAKTSEPILVHATADTCDGSYGSGITEFSTYYWKILVPTGNTYHVSTNADNSSMYFRLGYDLITPPDTTTHIENFTPANGSITASTAVTVAFDYYIASSYLPDIESIRIKLKQIGGIGTQQFDTTSAVYGTLTNVSHSFTLPTDTVWEVSVYFVRPGYLVEEVQIQLSPGFFSFRFSVETDPTNDNIECSITEVAGCFQKVFIFLFQPSDFALSKFTLLYEQIRTKPPFGYGFAIVEELTNTDLMGTEEYTLATFTAMDDIIFTPVRAGLVWLLWVVFAFGLFKSFRNMHL